MIAIARAIDVFSEGFGRIVAPLIAVITLIVIYDICLRFFIGRPSDWAFDVTKMLFGAHFMMMTAYGLRHKIHVEVDIIKNQLSRKKRAITEIFGYLVFFAPFIWMLLTYSWDYVLRAWSRGETTSGMMAIPVYPVKTVLLIASVILLLQALAIVIRAIQKLRETTS